MSYCYNRLKTTHVVNWSNHFSVETMTKPNGKLTPVQFEILEVLWDSGGDGASVADVWEVISAKRSVTRTTVLNLVDRLEKRGWLKRKKLPRAYYYLPTVDRETTAKLLAGEFLDDFFSGSPTNLVMSLLGSRRLKQAEVEKLRRLLDQASSKGKKQ